MGEWAAKRFWKDTVVEAEDGGYTIRLDGRAVKTPAKAALILPTRAMADAVAAEWAAQDGNIIPASMPVTRGANAAIDKVSVQHAEVAELLAAYGDADHICYRADSPQELCQRQAEAWDPLLDWAGEVLGVRLQPVIGVMHAPQDDKALKRLAGMVKDMDPFHLTAFHDLVGLSGSLIIGFAAIHNIRDIRALWQLSRVDELWQQEQWGVDDEASEQASLKESGFLAAKYFYDLAKKP